MTEGGSAYARDRRRTPALPSPYRLDLLVNPYGPSLFVNDALSSVDDLHLPNPVREAVVRERLAQALGVPVLWIALANGIDEMLDAALRLSDGPVAVFPPTDAHHARAVHHARREMFAIPRSHRYGVEVDPTAFTLPRGTSALVQSPNDPTGTILTAVDAVRLSRRSEFVIVDERHSAYSPRTVLPLVREFENMIVIRTFETWAGLVAFPLAYAVARPKISAGIEANRVRQHLAQGAVLAADATFADMRMVLGTVERIREEKARLFRTLRKLNMLQPFPSWANFLLARIERGEPDTFERALLEKGMVIHSPQQPGLERMFRVSATSAEATTMLRNALIDAAVDL